MHFLLGKLRSLVDGPFAVTKALASLSDKAFVLYPLEHRRLRVSKESTNKRPYLMHSALPALVIGASE